ncbi:MAG: phosphoribosylformylglycinamidine synthase subunit PurQ [Candidatus Omnitrophota bacterium]
MKFGIVVFPGSNCDQDCFWAVKDVLGEDVKYLWHQETNLQGFDCIILPGGFSYGDYLRPGAIAHFSRIMKSIVAFAKKGGLVLGICNGFQILLEVGLLPGAMLPNKDLHFICRYTFLRVENNQTPFTHLCHTSQVIKMPIAHHEGNFYIRPEGLKQLQDNQQIVLRYSNAQRLTDSTTNPNGAVDNIAGIINQRGNVFGLMPHPERVSEDILGSSDGLLIFKSIRQWLK